MSPEQFGSPPGPGFFTTRPGSPDPTPTLVIEAFGRLSRDADLPGLVTDEEDLYSVFLARSELMNWGGVSNRRSLLWGMNEAEVTAGAEGSLIGYVQVGLEAGVEPVMALPPLVQCFDDALRRFGAVELSGLQVTGYSLPNARSCARDLVSALNWFHTVPNAGAEALIALDDELLGDRTEAELVDSLRRLYTGPFEFGPPVAIPEQHAITRLYDAPFIPSPRRSGLGLSVTLPEWTAGAAAWVLAYVIDTARASLPGVGSVAVRLTRVR